MDTTKAPSLVGERALAFVFRKDYPLDITAFMIS